MIENILGVDYIVCDPCGIKERVDLPLVNGLISTMGEEGWTAEEDPPGVWYHKCPECNGYT